MGWTSNPIMEWSTNGGTTWTKITDHGRSPLSVSVERIESATRMADGTLRRYVIGKKRSYSVSWESIPSTETGHTFLADGHTDGKWIENFHDTVDGSFLVMFRGGQDRDIDTNLLLNTPVEVMITDFSKEVVLRGRQFDLWNLDLTLEEV